MEQGGSIEETSFLNVKDPTDPIELNSTQSFSKMAIKDHKDIKMSDQTKKDQNKNKKPVQNAPPYTKSKAKAEVENQTKVNYDSGSGQEAQPLSIIKTSAVDVMEERSEEGEEED